jgi:LacI family transcriptional regulator
MTNRLNIRKIAERAGVSTSTVSRILNGRKGANAAFSQATRHRILEVCKELNYSPNIHAKRLFTKRSNVIALVVPPRSERARDRRNVSFVNFSKVLSGIEDVLEDQDQNLLLVSAKRDFVNSGKYLKLFSSCSIDGMLIWGAALTDQYPLALSRENWPFILIDSYVQGRSLPSVTGDNYNASAALVKHLVSLGHRKIAYIAGPEYVSTAVDRLRGFQEQCAALDVNCRVYQGSFEYKEGYGIGRMILAEDDRPSAIAAVNDDVARGVLQAAVDMGLSVPSDLSVTGADGLYTQMHPKLTTFDSPMYEIGRQSAELLLEHIDQKTQGQRGDLLAGLDLQLNAELITGETTGMAGR